LCKVVLVKDALELVVDELLALGEAPATPGIKGSALELEDGEGSTTTELSMRIGVAG